MTNVERREERARRNARMSRSDRIFGLVNAALLWIVSIIMLYPLLYAVLSINETPLICYIYHIYQSSYLFTVLLTCGTSLVINLFFASLTNKVKMVESLKSVE